MRDYMYILCVQYPTLFLSVCLSVCLSVSLSLSLSHTPRYSVRDQENMSFILRFSSSVLSNTLAFQRELTLKKQNQALLQVAGNLFSQLSEFNNL